MPMQQQSVCVCLCLQLFFSVYFNCILSYSRVVADAVQRTKVSGWNCLFDALVPYNCKTYKHIISIWKCIETKCYSNITILRYIAILHNNSVLVHFIPLQRAIFMNEIFVSSSTFILNSVEMAPFIYFIQLDFIDIVLLLLFFFSHLFRFYV